MAVLTPLITLSYRCGPDQNSRAMLHLVALPALVAGAWTVRELVMGSRPYGGFPWGRLGMSQAASPLAEVSSWTGVSGLSFLIVALFAAGIEGVRWIRHDRRGPTAPRTGRWFPRGTAPQPAAVRPPCMLLLPQAPPQPVGPTSVGPA